MSANITQNHRLALALGRTNITKVDGSLLFANLSAEFEGAYYWSNTQYAGYAWVQNFLNGGQDTMMRHCT